MAWDHLSVNKPHLVYLILGGFTTLFMLCSSIIKERLYIGEATVATLVGVIFGPHAANLINPNTWGNTDQITLEFSRIVLVVQCFAVGVELPKYYMEKHWRSVVFLLVPVMTFGWLITSLFIWCVFYQHADWLDSLCMAACVTATDPVLASSVVGKGKFAKRVPKHLRDILSAESGCNDGMAFPFIYLALYIIKYRHHPNEVALHWFCFTILYECVFGCIFGVSIGYIARRLIRTAHERDYIDRESFLVFYFVLALFCAGAGSLLGMDDLLIGFACGVGFSNDGWFTEKTEETHVSNVIDLLINLAFFVYFGTIIPWDQYNNGNYGLDIWRFIVIALLVIFFRRIPAMLALKPFIPDVKTWREALFAGHFGPIGVGAIFVAILARAELEDGPHGGSVPLAHIPEPGFEHRNIIVLIWPITTFLVITSIVVHGSSVAVFTLGKHINTLAITMSYSRANEGGPDWMDRLPRIQSRSKSSMSLQRSESSFDNEKQLPSNSLPLAAAGNFLRRQRESDDGSHVRNRSTSRHRRHRSRNKTWDSGRGPGGPISQSAIAPTPRRQSSERPEMKSRSNSDAVAREDSRPSSRNNSRHFGRRQSDGETPGETPAEIPVGIYEEGHETVYENPDGEVLAVEDNPEDETQLQRETSEIEESHRLGRKATREDTPPPEADVTKKRADLDSGDDVGREESPEDRKSPNVSPGDSSPLDGSPEEKGSPESSPLGVSPEDSVEAGQDMESTQQENSKPTAEFGKRWRDGVQKMGAMGMFGKRDGAKAPVEKPARSGSISGQAQEERTPARAYQYGNTIILEDEDGEVIKKFEIPAPDGQVGPTPGSFRHRMNFVSTKLGFAPKHGGAAQAGALGKGAGSAADAPTAPPPVQKKSSNEEEDDPRLRFVTNGRRMSKVDFIESFRGMDPKQRMQAVEDSDAPEDAKRVARQEARRQAGIVRTETRPEVPTVKEQQEEEEAKDGDHAFYRLGRSNTADSTQMQRMQSHTGEVPWHDVSRDLRRHQVRDRDGEETAAERRRRLALQLRKGAPPDSDSEDDGTERVPPAARPAKASSSRDSESNLNEKTETAAEKRRRLGALGVTKEQDSDSEDDGQPRPLPGSGGQGGDYFSASHSAAAAAEKPATRQRTLRWASNVGRK